MGSLTKAVAAERKSAKKAQAQAKAFQLIGVGLNRTLGNVDEERTRALLISSDLLKVNHKLRDLLLSIMKENAESKRALAFFAGPKLQSPKEEEQATEGETGNAAPDQSADENEESTEAPAEQAPDQQAADQSQDQSGEEETTQEAPDQSQDQSGEEETTPPAEGRFADSRRHVAPISEASRLKELFYGSMGIAPRR